MNKIFLTGKKQVGKSTIIAAWMKAYPGRLGGFLTVQDYAFRPGFKSIHLIDVSCPEPCGESNLLFVCDDKHPNRQKATGAFERLGCTALSHALDADCIIMDELWPYERESVIFRVTVMELISSPLPILGVLQKADSPFLSEIVRHPSVRLEIVTEENRDALQEKLLSEIPGFLPQEMRGNQP